MGDIRNTYKILVRKPERIRPCGRFRSRWVDIKMDLKETGCEDVDWIHLAQDRVQWWVLVNVVMSLGFHKRWGGKG
jgi:hypothetical protein